MIALYRTIYLDLFYVHQNNHCSLYITCIILNISMIFCLDIQLRAVAIKQGSPINNATDQTTIVRWRWCIVPTKVACSRSIISRVCWHWCQINFRCGRYNTSLQDKHDQIQADFLKVHIHSLLTDTIQSKYKHY